MSFRNVVTEDSENVVTEESDDESKTTSKQQAELRLTVSPHKLLFKNIQHLTFCVSTLSSHQLRSTSFNQSFSQPFNQSFSKTISIQSLIETISMPLNNMLLTPNLTSGQQAAGSKVLTHYLSNLNTRTVTKDAVTKYAAAATNSFREHLGSTPRLRSTLKFNSELHILNPPAKEYDHTSLALLSGDIETNPGPRNPHKRQRKIKVVTCANLDTASLGQLKRIIQSSSSLVTCGGENSTKEEIKKCILDSTTYEQQLLHTPPDHVLYCFDGQGNLVCLFKDLSSDIHEIQPITKEAYKIPGLGFNFLDTKKILFQSHSCKNDTLNLPWCALTRSQMMTIAKDKCSGLTTTQATSRLHIPTFLGAKVKSSKAFKRQFEHGRLFDTSVYFRFNLKDPVTCSWSLKEDKGATKVTKALKLLFQDGAGNSNQHMRNDNEDPQEERNLESTVNGSESGEGGEPSVCHGPDNSSLSNQLLDISDITEPGLEISIIPSNRVRDAVGQEDTPHFELGGEEEGPSVPVISISEDKVPQEDCYCKTLINGVKTAEMLKCSLCQTEVHYKCYIQTGSRDALPHSLFMLLQQEYANCKWFCNSCCMQDLRTTAHVEQNSGDIRNAKPITTQETVEQAQLADHIIGMSGMLNDQADAVLEQQRVLDNMGRSLVEIRHRLEQTATQQESKLGKIVNILKGEESMTITTKCHPNSSYSRAVITGTDNYSGNAVTTERKDINTTRGTTIRQRVKTTTDPTGTVVVNNITDATLIRNSTKIKSIFNSHFPGVKINSCFISKGGSIFIECDEESEAIRVKEEWRPHFFNPVGAKEEDCKTTCKLFADLQRSLLIKMVPIEISDAELQIGVSKLYPRATVKRFIKSNQQPMSTIKIDFSAAEHYDDCLTNGFKINHTIYKAEHYEAKRRVIQCYKCWRFGHVAHLCKNKQACELCSKNHEGRCRFLEEENSRSRMTCVNCSGPHKASDKICKVYKDIVIKMGLSPINSNNDQNNQS